MSELVCRCTHRKVIHRRRSGVLTGLCGATPVAVNDEDRYIAGPVCPCEGFDDSVPPAPGERLEFGRHRLRSPDAETAPAWPRLAGDD